MAPPALRQVLPGLGPHRQFLGTIPHVPVPVYGAASANDANVAFPMSLALSAARDLHGLADDIVQTAEGLRTDAAEAREGWTGPHAETFTAKTDNVCGSAANLATALRHLADELGRSWAAARGQQDRINCARAAAHEVASDGWLENQWERVAGEDEFPPPDNPPAPGPPGYRRTRDPQYSAFGP
jgi:uncharacterized protein YukE